jgi:hypothetical protein
MTDTSRELEHEAATSRARLSGLLDELRFRVSPGEVVERLVREADRDGWARSSCALCANRCAATLSPAC